MRRASRVNACAVPCASRSISRRSGPGMTTAAPAGLCTAPPTRPTSGPGASAFGSRRERTRSRAMRISRPAFELLHQQGKTRFLGFTAIGDTAALQQVTKAAMIGSSLHYVLFALRVDGARSAIARCGRKEDFARSNAPTGAPAPQYGGIGNRVRLTPAPVLPRSCATRRRGHSRCFL